MSSLRLLLFFSLILALSSCSQYNHRDFLRKSANNRYFDTKSFHESKRLPAYNAKYIERAKQNLLYANNKPQEEYDDGESDEIESPTRYHREIYNEMLKDEDRRINSKSKKINSHKKQKPFYSKISLKDTAEESFKEQYDEFGEIAEYDDISQEITLIKHDTEQQKLPPQSSTASREVTENSTSKTKMHPDINKKLSAASHPPLLVEVESPQKYNIKQTNNEALISEKQQLESEITKIKNIINSLKQELEKTQMNNIFKNSAELINAKYTENKPSKDSSNQFDQIFLEVISKKYSKNNQEYTNTKPEPQINQKEAKSITNHKPIMMY